MNNQNKTKMLVLAAIFSALTAIGAFIKIPIPYVPIVMQVFFVLLSGCVLNSKWAFISQMAYLVIGLMGVPIFTNGGGFGYVLQPTFGYLIGYMAAAYVVGLIIEKSNNKDFKTMLFACLIGLAIIYLVGVPYLAAVLKFNLGKTNVVSYAIKIGFLVCLPADLIKAFFAAYLGVKIYGKI